MADSVGLGAFHCQWARRGPRPPLDTELCRYGASDRDSARAGSGTNPIAAAAGSGPAGTVTARDTGDSE